LPGGAAGYFLGVREAATREVDVSATDKMKNAVQDVEGKAKEAMGRATGDHSKEAEGRTDQTKSDLKDAGEKVKDAFKH
jgi:uncharacterized protein YjbJ (UPF0337 family)